MSISKIEWTDYTWNPWIGCTKVSQGCQNCYAETLAKRFKLAEWGKGKEREIASDNVWDQPIKWNKKAKKENKIYKVFLGSMMDYFDESVEDTIRLNILTRIIVTRHLVYLILTKRIDYALRYLSTIKKYRFNIPKNIMIGVSICTHREAAEKIPVLLEIKKLTGCNVFISMEPLLEEIHIPSLFMQKIDWVIVGGESGHKARPMNPEWARIIRNQCNKSNTPFFFKQWGEWSIRSALHECGDDWQSIDPTGKLGKIYDMVDSENRHVCYMQKVGKNRSGRILDGREYNEFPDILKNNFGTGAEND